MTAKQKTKNIISKVVKGYKGNPKIKKVGTHIEFTEEQKIELRKCKRDPIYFIRNYCKVVSLDRGLVPFELYQYQIDYLESIHNNRKVVAMFPRQAGKTITTAAYLLWYSVFNSNKNIAIMANKAKTSREILSRYQGMFEHLPIWMQQGVVSWNRGDVELENGSKVFTGATTKDGIRGQSCVTADTRIGLLFGEEFRYGTIESYLNPTIRDSEKTIVYYETHDVQTGFVFRGAKRCHPEEIVSRSFRGGSCFKDGTFGYGQDFCNNLLVSNPENLIQRIIDPVENVVPPEVSETCLVLTHKGFKRFKGILDQGIPKSLLHIWFESGNSIRCTPDHRFMVDGEWVEARHLWSNDMVGRESIAVIEYTKPERVYDLLEVEDTHSYVTNGVESHNCNILYIDECAIIPNNIAEEFFAAVYPVISAGNTTKVLITSTPKGYNHFWKIWTEAEQGQNGFVPIRAEYWQHPERDKAWADEQLRTLKEIKFNQEVLMHFLGSAHTLINGVSLGNMAMKQPLFVNENLEVLMEPVRGHSYVIVADTSRGVGGDYSAFTVIDVTEMPYMVVAKYRDNKISPLLYPDIIYRVANDYNEAYVLVEINDNGQQIADILFNDLEYENMFLIQSEPRIGQKLTTRHADKVYWGIKTTNQVKRIGCSVLKTLIEGNKLLIFDKDIISELSTFVETRGSYAADEGYHDDLVMCLVLFAWLSRQPLFVEMTNVNMRKELFEREQLLIEQDLTPFGYIDDGIEDEVVVEVEDGDLWVSDTDPDSYFRQLKDDMLRGH